MNGGEERYVDVSKCFPDACEGQVSGGSKPFTLIVNGSYIKPITYSSRIIGLLIVAGFGARRVPRFCLPRVWGGRPAAG